MASYNELAYDILEIVKGNQISDDVDISLEHIIYHLNNQRALFLRNEYNKPGRYLDQHLVQDLGCLELEAVDAADCCSVETDCVVLRTKKKLPPFLELHNGSAITRVGPINKIKKGYDLVSLSSAVLSAHNKYTKNLVFAFIINDYLHLISADPNHMMLDYVNVRGIIADPKDIIDFKCDKTGSDCFSYDDEYPINNWMIPYAKEQILQQLGMSLQVPKDNDNNAKDNFSTN